MDPARRSLIGAPLAFASTRSHAGEADPLLLTDAQREWIAAHPIVRYTVSFEARPFLFLEGGRPVGYVADLLAKASRLTGLTFEHVPSRDRDEALGRLARGEVDLVPLMRIDDSRRARIPLTQPVAMFTLGVFTRTDAPYVDGLSDLAGRRVGMPRGMADSLRLDEPVPRFIPFDSTVDGMRGLLEGRYDAVVAPVPVAQYWLRRLGSDAAWMQATLPLKVPFGMAASAEAAELVGILDAVLRRVHLPERRAMLDAWTGQPAPTRGAPIAAWVAAAVAVAGCAVALLARRRRRAARGGAEPRPATDARGEVAALDDSPAPTTR